MLKGYPQDHDISTLQQQPNKKILEMKDLQKSPPRSAILWFCDFQEDSRALRTSFATCFWTLFPPTKDTSKQLARPQTGPRSLQSPLAEQRKARRDGGGWAEARGNNPDWELGVELGLLVGFTHVLIYCNLFTQAVTRRMTLSLVKSAKFTFSFTSVKR